MPVSNASRWEPSIASEGIHDSDVIELWWRTGAIMRHSIQLPGGPMLVSMSYDALVVGSGPNGLAAAITMARSGWRVLVLEAADRPGGAVATEELTLPGFRHDTFSSVYPAGAASPVFARLPLDRHGLRWIYPTACFAHPLPDGGAV